MASLKIDYKLNAEDYISDLLAEAEYIFNNASEFLGDVVDNIADCFSGAEQEYALAA